jgi:protease I
MATILVPIPNSDFDPTETAVPWNILRSAGHTLVFATPDGRPGSADRRMLTGQGLGLLARVLMADSNARQDYQRMERSDEFQQPIAYDAIASADFQALLLPGGHAPGMKPYLESARLQAAVGEFFQAQKPVGAICHGVIVAARSRSATGRSVLWGKKTTALTKILELSGWALTRLWLKNYYRTYPQPVQDEVKAALASPADFIGGPLALTRDSPTNPAPGFTVLDGNYLSARWPGDAHRFGSEFAKLL